MRLAVRFLVGAALGVAAALVSVFCLAMMVVAQKYGGTAGLVGTTAAFVALLGGLAALGINA